MKRKCIRNLSLALVVVSATSLVGCGTTKVAEQVAKYPLVSMVSQQGIIDYYGKALEYDAVVSKNITVHETTYETATIDGSKADTIKKLYSKVEDALSKDTYDESIGALLSEDNYNYIKASIDSYSLSNAKLLDITGALGYYFVDVQYNISEQKTGKFLPTSDMLALKGVYTLDANNEYKIDDAFLSTAVARLKQYFYTNDIHATVSYDKSTGLLSIEYASDEDKKHAKDTYDDDIYKDGYTKDDINKNNTTEKSIEKRELNLVTASNPSSKFDTEIDIDDISVVSDSRKVALDVDLINHIVGSSLGTKAFLPYLDLVYDKPSSSGDLSGYAIYPEGINGLKIFGFNRNDLAGTLTLRYVFKEAVNGSGAIIGTNIYIKGQELTNSFNVSDQEVILPEFLQSQLDQIVERADRLQVDVNIPGLMSGAVYEDKGYGILASYKDISTNTLKYMSKIRQVIARDITNNAYLVEVETTVIEGAKSTDCYGTYKDTSYVVIQQQGDKFVISDSVRIKREINTEPSITPDTVTQKRLIALNLSGEVTDDAKSSVKTLLGNLYTAGTNRLLRGPKEITVNGSKLTLEYGMYDCFNSNVEMLTSDKLEYMNSQLRNVLVKYGNDTQTIYSGIVTEWIGGYDNQVEFTTEELATYKGRNAGHYMTVYYLVSNMSGKWVIDERKVIDEYNVSGSDLDTIKNRVGQ